MEQIRSKFGSLVKKPIQCVNACLLMESIVVELFVYYNDVLRYTIIANLDKVQELRNQGFYVQVKLARGQG